MRSGASPTRLHLWFVIALLMGLSACQGAVSNVAPTQPPTTSTDVPSATPSTEPNPTSTIAPVRHPDFPRPHYQFEVDLDVDKDQAIVHETLQFSNLSAQSLESILLIVEANRVEGQFELDAVSSGRLRDFELAGGYLVVNLTSALEPGESLELTLDFTLMIMERPGLLNRTDIQINLTDWYPYLPPMAENGQWMIAEPSEVGEHLSYPSADFEVNLKLSGEAEDWIVAASAPMQLMDDGMHATGSAMRTFDMSLSDQFVITQSESLSGIPVTVYSYAEHVSPAAYAAQAMADSIDLFTAILGSYPYDTLSLVEAEVPDGRESSGLFFLADGYFAEHQLYSWSWLSVLVPHETAHQWFFSQVGNESAFEPWLDEAMCTYMERIYFERLKPDRLEWWWKFRVYGYSPEGWVDSNIYDLNTYRRYVNAVYLRGALFLERLRLIMGEQAFFDFLRAYVEQGQGKIVTNQDFFGLVHQFTDRDFSDLLTEYFHRFQE